ncbi:hypothetical protein AeMF1_018669 [Aphanomyces euteiches]|nr:hypothetical protein AeMF1_018669 [Aphanomyces euteiches]
MQEAAEAVGTGNVGLERAMELLEVSVQQSQELADEARDNNTLTLDEFEARTTATNLQKDFESKRAASSSLATENKKPSVSKHGAERDVEQDQKRHKLSWGSASTTRDIATPEFPLGQESIGGLGRLGPRLLEAHRQYQATSKYLSGCSQDETEKIQLLDELIELVDDHKVAKLEKMQTNETAKESQKSATELLRDAAMNRCPKRKKTAVTMNRRCLNARNR